MRRNLYFFKHCDEVDLLEEKILKKNLDLEKKQEREIIEKDRAAKRVKNDKNKIEQKGNVTNLKFLICCFLVK